MAPLPLPTCHRCRKPIAANQLARAVERLPDGSEGLPIDVHAGCLVLAHGRYRRL